MPSGHLELYIFSANKIYATPIIIYYDTNFSHKFDGQ